MADRYDKMSDLGLAQNIIDLAEHADNFAMAHDGPVPPTWRVMDEKELRSFFRSAYVLATRTAGYFETDARPEGDERG